MAILAASQVKLVQGHSAGRAEILLTICWRQLGDSNKNIKGFILRDML
jgi:hypothetical protein